MAFSRPCEPSELGHSAALGTVVKNWSMLENQLTYLITLLAETDATTGHLLFSGLDQKTKASIAQTMILHRNLDREMQADLASALNLINNDLRIERNRAVHDVWISDMAGHHARLTSSPKVKNAPGSGARELLLREEARRTTDDLWELAGAIATVGAVIFQAEMTLRTRQPWREKYAQRCLREVRAALHHLGLQPDAGPEPRAHA